MTDSRVAFALRDEFREDGDTPFLGGLVAAGARELNIAELLEEGDGVIVVDAAVEPLVVTILDEYPALERVPAPDVAPTVGHADLTATELRAEAKRRGIAGAAGSSKESLVAVLTLDDARIAAGVPQPTDYSVHALLASGEPGDTDPATGRPYADGQPGDENDQADGDVAGADNDSPEA